MKSQATLVLLVLLVALFQVSECKVVKYKRTVNGRFVDARYFRSFVEADCTATLTFSDPLHPENEFTRDLKASSVTRVGSKGKFNTRVIFVDDSEDQLDKPRPKPTDLQVSCDLYVDGDYFASSSSSGKSEIEFGNL